MLRRGQEQEQSLVSGLYWVGLQEKTLDALEKDGLSVSYYGRHVWAATRDEKSMSGYVAVYRQGILARSFGEPWHVQLRMIAEENAKVQHEDPSLRIVAPPNVVTAIIVAQEVYRQYGFIIFRGNTRVGDGSLFTGCYRPGFGSAQVNGNTTPEECSRGIGVLPLAVRV